MTDIDLQSVRVAYARQILALAEAADDSALQDAFRTVPREAFLGADRWHIFDFRRGSIPLAENDPIYAYQNVLFVLQPARGVNNGEPALHARLIHALAPVPGQRVVHLGAGTGYYTAILAHLVGPDGSVTGVEFDPDLADRARRNCVAIPNITIMHGDAERWPQDEIDRVYVNFSVSEPSERWLDHLATGGRLVFPLGVSMGASYQSPGYSRGGALAIERVGDQFKAAHICPAFFIGREGADDPEAAERLRKAFRSPGLEFVKSLVWKKPADSARCWLSSSKWSLSYDLVH
ncbi:MAG: methyltransferase domain-containing protein [Litorimonas sp.]